MSSPSRSIKSISFKISNIKCEELPSVPFWRAARHICVVLTAGQEKKRTSVSLSRGGTSVWEEVFTFDDIQNPTLSLWLWEKDSVRIGGIAENVRDLLSDGDQSNVRRPLRKESPHGLGKIMSSFISFSIEHHGSNSLKDDSVFTLSPEFNLTGNVQKTGTYSFAGGGFGEIYRGMWTNPEGTNVNVAIKILRFVPEDIPVMIRRINREASVWCRLKHTNLLPFLGICDDFSRVPALVSPFCESGSIMPYLKTHPEVKRSVLMAGVADGLQYLHHNDIAHGDLKCDNVLISSAGTPLLCDFGRSRIIYNQGFTTANTMTARFSAPEVIELTMSNAQPIPHATIHDPDSVLQLKAPDIYGFAMTMLQVLTERLPYYYIRDEFSVGLQVFQGKVPDRSQYLDLPVGYQEWRLMEQCWSHDVKSRLMIDEVVARMAEIVAGPISIASLARKMTALVDIDIAEIRPYAKMVRSALSAIPQPISVKLERNDRMKALIETLNIAFSFLEEPEPIGLIHSRVKVVSRMLEELAECCSFITHIVFLYSGTRDLQNEVSDIDTAKMNDFKTKFTQLNLEFQAAGVIQTEHFSQIFDTFATGAALQNVQHAAGDDQPPREWTAIAAVNSDSHIRAYTQDASGSIHESVYEGSWIRGTAHLGRAKVGSPIAATSLELNHIRVYYVSADNKLKQVSYDGGSGWNRDTLGTSFFLAPNSKVAAVFVSQDGNLDVRVYAQLPNNTIQEFGPGKYGWETMYNFGPALEGSSIASTSVVNGSHRSIRLYFQAPNLDLIEQVYEDGKGWSLGSFTVNNAPPCTALAATSWMINKMHLRVYYTSTEGIIRERGNNGSGWFDGAFMAPGSTVSVVNWDDGYGTRVRVYCDNGTYACEWIWNHDRKWIAGAPSIFPA